MKPSLYWKKFFEYSLIGVVTFIIDLLLLWYLTQEGVSYLAGTAIAFLSAVTLNYIISRSWVFLETSRGFGRGYLYFIGIALAGAAFTVAFLFILVEVFRIHYILGRVLIGGFIGAMNFSVNYYFNFQIEHINRHHSFHESPPEN